MDSANHLPKHPLDSLDDWEDELLKRYPSAQLQQSPDTTFFKGSLPSQTDASAGSPHLASDRSRFRDYEAGARPSVRQFYELNHRYQTLEFVRGKKQEFLSLNRCRMGIWEAMEYLNTLVDDSDPDIDLPQIEHLLQTAEAIRHDNRPRWFILAGLIHDLGKILCLWDEPQWAVVGDTFPVGCQYSPSIVFYDMFRENPDWRVPEYQTQFGIYEPGCGLEKVELSWGHDEYMYHVVKDYLPAPALAMIRYHSCYPIHREGAYAQFLTDADRELMNWVRDFNQYDLYTKRDERMDVSALRPFYEELIDEYFPKQLAW
ncbi:MAG: inositol oxygenase [bacterium]|nr:inositol oxygenase [bacterium]